MKSGRTLDWLLEEDQPSVRSLALTRLLDRPLHDPEVVAAKDMIPKKGWAHEILAKQDRAGWWVSGESLYRPKYLSTHWMLLILADLGLTRADPRIEKACDLWIERFSREDGGFAMDGSKKGHLCTTGNAARALVQFGYADHPAVRRAFEWLVTNSDKHGGWSCFGSGRNLDSWEGMSAFAVYPKEKWTEGMKRSVELGAEYYLEKELHKQGGEYPPWYRFHYPVHYYYDLLVGLDFMTGTRLRCGPAIAIRAGPSPRQEAAGWDVEPRRDPSGRRRRRGRLEREASKAGANAICPREARRAEQADHPEGHASVESSQRFDLNESTPESGCAHDLISHGVVRRAVARWTRK